MLLLLLLLMVRLRLIRQVLLRDRRGTHCCSLVMLLLRMWLVVVRGVMMVLVQVRQVMRVLDGRHDLLRRGRRCCGRRSDRCDSGRRRRSS